MKPDFDVRAAGVLLHLTSLPGPHGNGDLGPSARWFSDFLARARQGFWQMLPVNPAGGGSSPYSGASAFAGNPMLVSLEDLHADGLLTKSEVSASLPRGRVDYARAARLRERLLRVAGQRFLSRGKKHEEEIASLRRRNTSWLGDYCLFMALRDAYGSSRWTRWPRDIAARKTSALREARVELAREIAHYEVEQLFFDRQFRALRRYCDERSVALIGDVPIFVSHESSDVWAHQDLFYLDDEGEPSVVAGVPPDYFSKTGQRWGNPLYRWQRLARDGYAWWIERFRSLLDRFDAVRLDHFIGFSRYWEVPANEPTAAHGRWRPGPGAALFDTTRKVLGALPFIAEDLGAVTPEVMALRDRFELPGMRVLEFAFGSDVQADSFLPHNYVPKAVAYTGTHDNDTIRGWFEDRGRAPDSPRSPKQAAAERKAVIEYIAGPGARRLVKPVHQEAIRTIYASTANTAIIPMQDILGLGSGARMNTPGQADGWWTWRLQKKDATPEIAAWLRSLATTYRRLPRENRETGEATSATKRGKKRGTKKRK